MKFVNSLLGVLWWLDFVVAQDAGITYHNAPGESSLDTRTRIARALSVARQNKDRTFRSNRTVLDTSWIGATLLKQGLYADVLPLFVGFKI